MHMTRALPRGANLRVTRRRGTLRVAIATRGAEMTTVLR
jgi:hypothetical protein